jgi:Arylsulfotransferase (ASST)
VTGRTSGTAPSYVFLALKEGAGEHGPMILDDRGQLVWFEKYITARDFKVQRYRGRPVLTWWEGSIVFGHGVGEYVIFDDSYREIARVRAGNGFRGDLHEFLITPEDTALLTAYAEVPADLSSAGGREYGAAWEGIFQEVDIETGEVLLEWHSLEHVGVDESYVLPSEDPAYVYDYFHINSIDVDHDGNLLASARNTWAVYKIDPESGEVLWRLGGKKSDFEMGDGTRTAFQHDATAGCINTDLPAGRRYFGQSDRPLIEIAHVHHACGSCSVKPAVGATRTAPSPSSTTAPTRRYTSSCAPSCCASTRRR